MALAHAMAFGARARVHACAAFRQSKNGQTAPRAPCGPCTCARACARTGASAVKTCNLCLGVRSRERQGLGGALGSLVPLARRSRVATAPSLTHKGRAGAARPPPEVHPRLARAFPVGPAPSLTHKGRAGAARPPPEVHPCLARAFPVGPAPSLTHKGRAGAARPPPEVHPSPGLAYSCTGLRLPKKWGSRPKCPMRASRRS